MERGAWRAAVHWVAQSRTRLKWLSSSDSIWKLDSQLLLWHWVQADTGLEPPPQPASPRGHRLGPAGVRVTTLGLCAHQGPPRKPVPPSHDLAPGLWSDTSEAGTSSWLSSVKAESELQGANPGLGTLGGRDTLASHSRMTFTAKGSCKY